MINEAGVMRVKRAPNQQPDLSVPDYALAIKKARQECGLHQKDIAKLLNVSTTAVSLWESGERKITVKVLHQVGVICNCWFLVGAKK